MAVKQIRDIVAADKEIHQQMIAMLRSQEEKTDDYRYTAVLEFLDKKEQDAESLFKKIPGDVQDKVLNTFIRYYPTEIEDEARRLTREDQLTGDTNPIEALIGVKQRLVDILDECLEDSVIPEAQDFLSQVRDYEMTQLQSVSRQFGEYLMER